MPAPSPAKPAATRNDVARLARVSPAVVSYVVNRSKRVSPETEARVRQAIAMLGYRPNSAARSLRLGSTETLGMLVPDTTNSYFASLAHQVELAAIRRGRDLIVGNSDGSLDATLAVGEGFELGDFSVIDVAHLGSSGSRCRAAGNAPGPLLGLADQLFFVLA